MPACTPTTSNPRCRPGRGPWSRAPPIRSSIAFETPGGSYRWFLTRAIPLWDEDHRIVKWYGTCTDIDEQKRARDSLRTEKERLKLAFEAGRMCTWDWDASTGQIVWSESREQIHGLPPDGIDGTIESFRGVIHPDDRVAVELAIRESIERGRARDRVPPRATRRQGPLDVERGQGHLRRGRTSHAASSASAWTSRTGSDRRSGSRPSGAISRGGSASWKRSRISSPSGSPSRKIHSAGRCHQPLPHRAAWRAAGHEHLLECGTRDAAQVADLPRRPRARRRRTPPPEVRRHSGLPSATRNATWSSTTDDWSICWSRPIPSETRQATSRGAWA